MKRKLNIYNGITGIGEYDAWSYCADTDMWYEDANEVLPQPRNKSEQVADLHCEIKVDWFTSCEDTWENASYEQELQDYAHYLLGEDNACDCVCAVVLFRSPQQAQVVCLSQYGIWELADFADKVKSQPFATQYCEQWNRYKLIAWTDNQPFTRFVIHDYNEETMTFKTLLDITVNREQLVSKLGKAVQIWKDAVYRAITEQGQILGKTKISKNRDNAVAHFFPDLVADSK